MERGFKHAEVFPLVARLIVETPSGRDGYVSHRAIVATLLADSVARPLIATARERLKFSTDEEVARNMVAWFSQKFPTDGFAYREFFDRHRRWGVWAYRPWDRGESDQSVVEGNLREFTHRRRERDPRLAKAKREEARTEDGRLRCEVCGFEKEAAFPRLRGYVCEIHHCLPLGDALRPVETRLEDLAVLCPNCHTAIHRTEPLLSVEDFRSRFFSGAES